MDMVQRIPEGSRIAIDTAPFIYYIEGGSTYDELVTQIFERCISTGRNPASTSVITLAEVLAGTYQAKRADLEEQYRSILAGSRNLDLVSITPEIADDAARLRSQYNLKLPDAFQLAAALSSESEFLITNDSDFKNVTEIPILILSEMKSD